MLKLDLNLLWTVVDVLILYVLLRKFLFKPIQNVLDQRQKYDRGRHCSGTDLQDRGRRSTYDRAGQAA